ncbi:MAG: YifB family Mg chelatase-like AAA ATPase [Alistipes sp.]|nr:YifB family Mg chelatase-like AAA ATPase [Alistipes sp.]
MFVRTYAGAIAGIDAIRVTVEVNLTGSGLGLYLVGLPDNAVKESEQRIRAAFENSGRKMSGRKIVVNLAPADLRKEGSGFDLPIAVGILAAMEEIDPAAVADTLFAGELSLDGSLRPVRGILPIAVKAREEGLRRLVVPAGNGAEAAVVEGIEVYALRSLDEVIGLLDGTGSFAPVAAAGEAVPRTAENPYAEDFADVKGQAAVKRALEIAAAGGHNVLMIGAPGSGKTMLARRMPTILPPLGSREALETTKIHSVAGKLGTVRGLLAQRPFRSPHHLTSQVALIGGGQSPQPGEISLAHNGVLFLDELPEFGRNALEVLRQPLEEKRIVVSRARYSVEYPANFTLIAAMNPCPCGYYNHPTKECSCPPGTVHRYLNRISGPLLDRIDLQVEVTPVAIGELSDARPAETSAAIRERVVRARAVQAARFRTVEGVHTNAMMNARMLREFCPLGDAARRLLEQAMARLDLSARAYDRIVKVARTIADLEGAADIGTAHLAEAINYRSLDRGGWGR